MANYYYYAPLSDNGEAGLGLILLFVFGVISSLVSQWFGSWSNFFLVAGLTIVVFAGLALIIKMVQRLYKKRCQTLQKRLDEERTKQANKSSKS